MAIRAYGRSQVFYDTWVALTEYSLTDRVVPTVPDGQCYECTTAGTSGATEPSWDSVPENTTEDGTVVWTCKDIPSSPNPLTVEIDISNQGGLALLEIWINSNVSSDFVIYGSHLGTDGTWRYIDTISVPHAGREDRHEGFLNAYHRVRVSVDGVGEHEIEIIAGEM